MKLHELLNEEDDVKMNMTPPAWLEQAIEEMSDGGSDFPEMVRICFYMKESYGQTEGESEFDCAIEDEEDIADYHNYSKDEENDEDEDGDYDYDSEHDDLHNDDLRDNERGVKVTGSVSKDGVKLATIVFTVSHYGNEETWMYGETTSVDIELTDAGKAFKD